VILYPLFVFKTPSAASPVGICRQSSARSGGVAAGLVIDEEVDPIPIIQGLVDDLCHVLDHLWIQHARDHLVEWEALMSQEQI